MAEVGTAQPFGHTAQLSVGNKFAPHPPIFPSPGPPLRADFAGGEQEFPAPVGRLWTALALVILSHCRERLCTAEGLSRARLTRCADVHEPEIKTRARGWIEKQREKIGPETKAKGCQEYKYAKGFTSSRTHFDFPHQHITQFFLVLLVTGWLSAGQHRVHSSLDGYQRKPPGPRPSYRAVDGVSQPHIWDRSAFLMALRTTTIR